jgi:hypothetical protein
LKGQGLGGASETPESRSTNQGRPAKAGRLAGKKGGAMETDFEAATATARERAAGLMDPARTRSPLGPVEYRGLPVELVPRRPPATLQRLWKLITRETGSRGARLAEQALRAGLMPPARYSQAHGGGSLEAALWMELARENAALRREAARLAERKESLARRIQRAKGRLQLLRFKLAQRRLGATNPLAGRPETSGRRERP